MANIVVCADGTWNRPEEELGKDQPTNVLKLARGISPGKGANKQHVFYDWGLGSYHNRGLAGTTGRGIHKNILDGYRYIVHNYAPGDRIFLFGFSRGAYTVRAIGGLINNCGIIKRAEAKHIARAWNIYKSAARKNHPSSDEAKDFRDKFSHSSLDVHFVGVWDTVGALGIPFSLMGLFDANDEFYDNRMGSNIVTARHALAIDERREDFAPTLWEQVSDTDDVKQIWFAGSHSDIGGGYPADADGSRIANVPLKWMLGEARKTGLIVEDHVVDANNGDTLARIHKSRTKLFRFRPARERGLEHPEIRTAVHPSVKDRYEKDAGYRPGNLVKLIEKHNDWDEFVGS